MLRTYFMLFVVTAWTMVSCSHQPDTHTAVTVRTIEISDVVKPKVLYVNPGDEVRWQNLRSNPVRLGFLSTRLLDEIGCEEGLESFFGEVHDIVIIPPGKSVSLCLLRSGDLQYNVWFDAENIKGMISPTATVRVEHQG